tara:strand:- start:124 stop:375 length:252 start_codon:yes stop_codon:yes gene_type:complete
MKELLDALTAALTGSGAIQDPQPSQTWFVCISDGQGGQQTYEAGSVFQAETMVREWLAAGWPAWVQDEEGRHLTIATKPREMN